MDNVGVFLRNSRWDWEKRSGKGEQLGLGIYPHLELSDAAATVEKARKAGYRVVQEPREYDFGTEAFIADPDGYTWAFVSPPKVASGRLKTSVGNVPPSKLVKSFVRSQCAKGRRAQKLRGIFDEAANCNDLLVKSIF
jgi:hypothetical protein